MLSTEIPIADLLRALRVELQRAEDDVWRSGRQGLLKVKEAEVEINVVAKYSAEGQGEAKVLGLFAVGLGASVASEQVHRVKLTLEAIGDRDVEVAGQIGDAD